MLGFEMRRSLLLFLLTGWLWAVGLGLVGMGDRVWAGPLADRIAQFPEWQSLPALQPAKGDLAYPDWFAGTWDVTTTLVDLVAPLAPELTTPGFEGNRQYVGQPVPFQARFVRQVGERSPQVSLQLPQLPWGQPPTPALVSDRAFNGLNLARAYLDQAGQSKSMVLAVKVDPRNPNRQLTILRGSAPDAALQERQLLSTVTARATEAPSADRFITTELFQQEFRGAPQLYFNQVETTTAYQHLADGSPAIGSPAIAADQITAIYLSPQDPDYFKAGDRPVALYRYRMEFRPIESKPVRAAVSDAASASSASDE
ncbi:MAG TPA: hypothetical protein V6C88_10230 [Chroococcidiopsis sp.]